MTEQKAFTVPKDRQEVTVVLNGGAVLTGAIFLEFSSQELSAHHRVVAFLEDGNNFFPLLLKENAGTEFIHKKKIRLIEMIYGPDQEKLNDAFVLMHYVDITAIFTDDTSIKGALMAEVPIEKARLSDCLNLPDRFLYLKMADRICYINKDALHKVIYAQNT